MVEIKIDPEIFPKRLSIYLFGVCVLLVICDVIFTYLDVTGYYLFRRSFDMTREESIPNWYASILLFGIGLTCSLLAVVHRAIKSARSLASTWLFFALFCGFLSADDGARIHERAGPFFKDLTQNGIAGFQVFGGVLESSATYSWQIFVLPIFLFVGFFMLIWGHQHIGNKQVKRWVLLGAGCIAVAIALDYFEGLVKYKVISLDDRVLSAETIEHFQRVIEEFLEMTGFILALRGLSAHLFELMDTSRLTVSTSQDA